MSHYYVYEHIRTDTGNVFYVGKGHKNRAWDFTNRSQHWWGVKFRLNQVKEDIEVRIVHNSLSDHDALRLERERIAHWMELNIPLVNKISPLVSFQRYSRGEERLLNILLQIGKENRSIGTEELVDLYYEENKPFHCRPALIRALSSLERKIKVNKEPFLLVRSGRHGPHEQYVHLTPSNIVETTEI